MQNIIELTAQIVAAHAASTQMSTDELADEIHKVHSALKALESSLTALESPEAASPKISLKQAFKKDKVVCMICGKSFVTLKRHLGKVHDLKPGEYRKQFNIPSTQPLVSQNYSESKRKAAQDNGLADVLAKARSSRLNKSQVKSAKPTARKKSADSVAKTTPVAKKKAVKRAPKKS